MEEFYSILKNALELKQGNKEFAAYLYEDGSWMVGLGNTCEHVLMFEGAPECQGHGSTLEEAMLDLIVNLQRKIC